MCKTFARNFLDASLQLASNTEQKQKPYLHHKRQADFENQMKIATPTSQLRDRVKFFTSFFINKAEAGHWNPEKSEVILDADMKVRTLFFV